MRELQVLPQDQLQLLFANLEQMFELHSQFCNAMKAVRKDNQVVQNIGHVLLNTVSVNLFNSSTLNVPTVNTLTAHVIFGSLPQCICNIFVYIFFTKKKVVCQFVFFNVFVNFELLHF